MLKKSVLLLPVLFVATMAWNLEVPNAISAQRGNQSSRSGGTIEAGSTINVITSDKISAKGADGRVYEGSVQQDVRNTSGNVAIPKGAKVELLVKRISDNEFALDLDAVTINDQRYGIDANESTVASEQKQGVGANERTGKYVGGGALLGAVIGAIAGGGKGAAIGAGAGAAAGAGTQVLTRGKSVEVPAETLVTFKLERALRTPAADNGFNRAGSHYHAGYGNDVPGPAYRAGLQAGRSDRDRNLRPNTRSEAWSSTQDRRDYEAGYNRGYNSDGKEQTR